MPANFTYITIDLLCLIFPFLLSFHPKIKFFNQWKYFFFPCLLTATFFIGWDILFTHMGVWSFNENYVLGFYFFNLPLEELLFFICIPYACVFTYHCMKIFLTSSSNNKTHIFSLILLTALAFFGLLNLSKLYTSVTFLLLAFLLAIPTIKRVAYMFIFYISFLIILLPFFISNGILTGSFIEEPVVLYNNTYNLGLRMFTIPVEDTFYGMLLMLINVILYEFLLERKGNKKDAKSPLKPTIER